MSKGVRKQGHRNRNCNDRFSSSHFCAPAFDMFILSDSESCLLFKPLWPLWPYHMPLTGGKPRLAGYSQSPHMLRGGTKRETDAISLARIPLCKKKVCLLDLCRLLCGPSQEWSLANDATLSLPTTGSPDVVPDPSLPRDSVLFLFIFWFSPLCSVNKQWQSSFDCSLHSEASSFTASGLQGSL